MFELSSTLFGWGQCGRTVALVLQYLQRPTYDTTQRVKYRLQSPAQSCLSLFAAARASRER